MTKNSITLDVDPTIMEKNMRIVKETPVEGELKKLLSSVDTVPSRLVKPTPGFCVKTTRIPDNKKVFVNICQTDAIPCPRDITNDELMYILSSEDPSSYRVPMSIGEGRTEHDKSGAPATAYDVAVNPEFFKKIEKDELFQTFFLTVVFEGLQDKYQFEIDMQKFTILKNRKSIGTLQSHRIQIRDIQQTESKIKPPLIEEIKGKALSRSEAAHRKNEIVFRLRREPPTGEIEYLLAEFKIPASVEVKDLNLEVGEDRLVLDSKGVYEPVDFFLPCSVDQDIIDAQLDRNIDILSVKMPVIH
ncbi:PIH1 domain-containing protein 1-like [Bombyx mandarina]|uniref:PIH1 domain-containing protein 1 n=2 Tax=Bombyx TaxID=7090 RepID=A0A8R2AN44_BOMMO|nr:PIH1 domain-containing protein 1 [Bombyx mori]XP_028042367.1 PIH1 domain-containing protein 1-like [Bombyx mandarina]XP_028042368.1 PIH1 domain-containing protein 1-like [Bombyx mandarina]